MIGIKRVLFSFAGGRRRSLGGGGRISTSYGAKGSYLGIDYLSHYSFTHKFSESCRSLARTPPRPSRWALSAAGCSRCGGQSRSFAECPLGRGQSCCGG